MQQLSFQVKSPWRRTHLPTLCWGTPLLQPLWIVRSAAGEALGRPCSELQPGWEGTSKLPGLGSRHAVSPCAWTQQALRWGSILSLKCIFSHNLSASQKMFADSSCPLLPSSNVFIPRQKLIPLSSKMPLCSFLKCCGLFPMWQGFLCYFHTLLCSVRDFWEGKFQH